MAGHDTRTSSSDGDAAVGSRTSSLEHAHRVRIIVLAELAALASERHRSGSAGELTRQLELMPVPHAAVFSRHRMKGAARQREGAAAAHIIRMLKTLIAVRKTCRFVDEHRDIEPRRQLGPLFNRLAHPICAEAR